MWPSHACTMVPGTASAAASASEVPRARRTGMCSTFMNNGARMKPPLLPSSPETSAATATTAAVRGVDGLAGTAASTSPSSDAVACAPSNTRRPRTSRIASVARTSGFAADPAGAQRADRGQRKPDHQAEAEHPAVDVAGPGVAPARQQGRRDRGRERRGDGDDGRNAEGVQQGSGHRGAALAERARQEADAGPDQQRSEQQVDVHTSIQRPRPVIGQASRAYRYHRIDLWSCATSNTSSP